MLIVMNMNPFCQNATIARYQCRSTVTLLGFRIDNSHYKSSILRANNSHYYCCYFKEFQILQLELEIYLCPTRSIIPCLFQETIVYNSLPIHISFLFFHKQIYLILRILQNPCRYVLETWLLITLVFAHFQFTESASECVQQL